MLDNRAQAAGTLHTAPTDHPNRAAVAFADESEQARVECELGGRHQIIRRLRSGGFGAVYLAREHGTSGWSEVDSFQGDEIGPSRDGLHR